MASSLFIQLTVNSSVLLMIMDTTTKNEKHFILLSFNLSEKIICERKVTLAYGYYILDPTVFFLTFLLSGDIIIPLLYFYLFFQ